MIKTIYSKDEIIYESYLMAECARLDTMTDLVLESVASSYEEGVLTFEAAKEKSEKGLAYLIQGLFRAIQEMMRKAIEKIQSNRRARKLGKTLDPETKALLKQAKAGSLKGPDIIKLASVVRKAELFIDKFMDQSLKMLDDLTASRSITNLSAMQEKKERIKRFCDEAQKQYKKIADEGNAIAAKTIVYTTDQACDMIEAGYHQVDSLDRLRKRVDDAETRMTNMVNEIEYETGNIIQRAPRIIKEAIQKIIAAIRGFMNEHKMMIFAIDTAIMTILTIADPTLGIKVRIARSSIGTVKNVVKTVQTEREAGKIMKERPEEVAAARKRSKNKNGGMDEDILSIAKSIKTTK